MEPNDVQEATLAAGLVLAERYRLVRAIGRGGSSVVWVADHVVTGKRVALKVLTKRGDDVAARFLREARITSQLDHPNIVDIHDVFQLEESDELVMVMDLLEGVSLAEHLRERGALPLAETARMVLAVTSALEAAHAMGVVHRDLKPENVFLSADGALRVLDFGVAKWIRPVSEAMLTPSLTETGAIVGTPHYMAPEQVFGEADLDARADIWALGVIAYECLAGRRPIEGENFGQVFKAIAMGDIEPLRTLAPALAPEIVALVDRMLSRSREARPSLAEVRAAFASAPSRSLSAPARSVAPPPASRPRFARWLPLAVALTALSGLGVGASRLGHSAPGVASASSSSVAASLPVASGAASSVATLASSPGASVSAASSTSTAPTPHASASAPRAAAGPARSVAPPSPPALPGRVHGAAPY